MYPFHYYSHFPPFAHDDTVFVAMSFAPLYEQRYFQVIDPAIRDVGLTPRIVRAGTVSDSILTKILEDIGRARLIFADITSSTCAAPDVSFRNENVMYELGIAHGRRLPEEVIVFRSDSDYLSFDVRHVRVNSYDPDGSPEEARKRVADALQDAVKETDLRRSMAVRLAADALDYTAWAALTATNDSKRIGNELGITEWHQILPKVAASEEGYSATRRLLELGLLRTEYRTPKMPHRFGTPLNWQGRPLSEVMEHRLSSLGEAVLREIAKRFLEPTAHGHP